MDSIGTADKLCAGNVERATSGSGAASKHVGRTYDRRHSLGDVFHSGHVDGVAIPYW